MEKIDIDKLEWWHTIELPDGRVTRGQNDYRGVGGERYLLPQNVENKTVIDFGTWDGFFAINGGEIVP